MSTQRNFCRLCVTQCEDHKSLFDQNGQCTGVYQLMDKYFNSKLLNTAKGNALNVLCTLCWRQIFDFHNFQQFVFEAQEKLYFNCHNEPDLKFIHSTAEVNEFIRLESTESNNVQQHSCGGIFINDDIGKSISLPQQEIIEVFSIADSSHTDDEVTMPNESDYPEKELYINEISEILSSDEEAEREMNEIEFRTQGSCIEAVEGDMPPQVLDSAPNDSEVTNKIPKNSNTEDKNTKNLLMDVDYDAIIAQWKPNLKCRLCSKNYSSFKLLRLHFRQKHPLSNFYVVCCRRKFTYRCKLGEHIRRHMNPYPYKCEFCTKSYTRKAILISHMCTHQTNIVNKELSVGQAEIVSVNQFNGAKNSLATTTEIEELLRSGESYQPTQYEVNANEHTNLGKYTKQKKNKRLKVTTRTSESAKCAKVLNENSLKDIHEDDAVISQWKPSLTCVVCGQSYLLFTSLRKHFRQKHPQDTFYIECCRRKFKYRCKLGDHIRRHINPHPFKCTFCVKKYSQRSNLITHMQHVHDHQLKATDKKLDDLMDQWKEDLECAHCSRSYSSLHLLRHHFRYKHPKKIFHVLCCGRKFTRRWEIEAHIRSHLKIFVSIFKCEHCDKCFTSRRSLDIHKSINHKDNIKCKQFDDKHDNKKDIERAEEKLDNTISQWKTNLKCMACGETLTTYTLLQDHYRKEHPNDKCYIVCCRQNLRKRTEIEDHMRLHCNPETHVCTICEECFIRSEDLNSHKQRKHPERFSKCETRASNRHKNSQASG